MSGFSFNQPFTSCFSVVDVMLLYMYVGAMQSERAEPKGWSKNEVLFLPFQKAAGVVESRSAPGARLP